MKKRRVISIVLTLAILLTVVLAGCSGGGSTTSTSPASPAVSGGSSEATPAQSSGEPQIKPQLKVAMIGEPASLDAHMTSSYTTQEIAFHMIEGLYTIDKDYNSVPMLAEDTTVNADSTQYTIKLREGVKFHNGKELTSEDVVASLNRWVEKTSYGAILGKILDRIEATSTYVVDIYLTQPSVVVTTLLAFPNQQTAIYPKESIEAADEKGVPAEYLIGTGPYQFVEHKADQYVKMKRFEGYSARSEEPNGHFGKKTAYFEELLFIPVPEDPVRKDGISTGEYHYSEQVSTDLYELVEADPNSIPVPIRPERWPMLVLNKQEGIFSDVKARQALLACLDMDECMKAAYGSDLFYRIDCSAMFVEQPMYSTGGQSLYNQKNPEKAKQLLAETDYNGEPIVWYTTKEYPYMYKIAVVAVEQMKAVGLNVDLRVVDWATIVQTRSNPAEWNIFSGATTFTPDPGVMPHLDGSWPGWWVNAEKDAMIVALNSEQDTAKRQAIWDEFQEKWLYGDVPFIKVGDGFVLSVKSPKLQNLDAGPFTYFWNCYLED